MHARCDRVERNNLQHRPSTQSASATASLASVQQVAGDVVYFMHRLSGMELGLRFRSVKQSFGFAGSAFSTLSVSSIRDSCVHGVGVRRAVLDYALRTLSLPRFPWTMAQPTGSHTVFLNRTSGRIRRSGLTSAMCTASYLAEEHH